MKRITILAFILIIALSLYGCFVNKFYNEKDLINVPVTGKWVQANDTAAMPAIARIWDIAQTKDKEYIVKRMFPLYKTKGGTEQMDRQIYDVHFFKINNRLYADIVITDNSGERARSLAKIKLEDNKMTVSLLNEDYLDRCIRNNKYHLTHTVSDNYMSDGVGTGGMIYYTAPTNELQDFIGENDTDKELFYKTLILLKSQ